MSKATYIPCPTCKGTGMSPDGELWPCETCKGTKEVCSVCHAPAAHAEDGIVIGGCEHEPN
jgi:hypothetical protein